MKEPVATKQNQHNELFCWAQFLVLLGTCIAVIYPSLSAGKLLMLDNVVHLAQLKIIVRDLIPRYSWLCGWSMYDFAGFDSLMYYGQAGFILPVTLVKIFHFPFETAYKLTLLVSLFFPGLMLTRMLRPYTGHAGALFAGLGFIALHNVISPTLGGIWAFFMSLGFVFLFLDNLFSREHTIRQVPLRGFLLSAALWTHPYSIPVAAIFSGVYLLRTKLVKLPLQIAPYLFAAVATFFYTAPIIATRNWLKAVPMPRDLNTMLAGLIKQTLFPFGTEQPWGLCVFILFMLSTITYIAFFRQKESLKTQKFIDSLLLSFPLFLLCSSGLLGQSQIKLLKALSIDGFRTMVPAQAIMLTMVAYIFKTPLLFPESKKQKAATKLTLILCFAVVSVLAHTITIKGRQLLKPTSDTIHYTHVDELRKWMSENIDKNSCRVLVQDTLGNSENPVFRNSHLLADLGTDTGIQTMGTWLSGILIPNETQVSTEAGRFMGRRISGLTNKYIYNYLQTYNIQFIVCCSKRLFHKLDQTDMFKIVFDSPEFLVFELKPMFRKDTTWTDNNRETIITPAPNSRPFAPRMDWIINNSNPLKPLEFKFQYHPFWKADWNGNPITLLQAKHGNMILIPPEHTTKAKLSLIYNFKPWTLFSLSILMSACLSLLCLIKLTQPEENQMQTTAKSGLSKQAQLSPNPHPEQARKSHKNRTANRKKKKRTKRRKTR